MAKQISLFDCLERRRSRAFTTADKGKQVYTNWQWIDLFIIIIYNYTIQLADETAALMSDSDPDDQLSEDEDIDFIGFRINLTSIQLFPFETIFTQYSLPMNQFSN